MANKSTTDFKRHFPRMNKCCFCFSLRKGVLVSTIILLVIGIINVFTSKFLMKLLVKNGQFIIYAILGLTFNIIYCASLLFLLIGIKKGKLFFMKQFKYSFGLYLIYSIIISVIAFYKTFTLEYYDELKETQIKFAYEFGITEPVKNDDIDDLIGNQRIIYIVEYIIIYSLYIYYYISTCSYIEDVEENLVEEKEARNLENNEY